MFAARELGGTDCVTAAGLGSVVHYHGSFPFMVYKLKSAAWNYHALLLSTRTLNKDIVQPQENATVLCTTKSNIPISTADQPSTMRKEMSSCSVPTTFQQTSSSCASFHQSGQALGKF